MAIFGRRVPHQPIILRPTVLGAAAPPVASPRIVFGADQAVAAATNRLHHPLVFRPTINGIVRFFQRPSVARIVQGADQAATSAAGRYRRPFVFRPIINSFVRPTVTVPPVASPRINYGADQSINAAEYRFHRPFIFRPTIETVIQYALPVSTPPVASPQINFGLDQAINAANLRFHHPYLFRPIQKTVTKYSPPGPPTPVHSSLVNTVARVPDIDTQDGKDRLRRFTEKIGSITNSLLTQGAIKQTGPTSYSLVATPFAYTVAVPGNWAGTPPTTEAQALDRLVAWVLANTTTGVWVTVLPKP